MEIIQHVQNIQYGYLLNKYKMGHVEGNFMHLYGVAQEQEHCFNVS